MRIVGIRRLVDDNQVVHAYHNNALWPDRTNITACGILFVGYDIPNEGVESSLSLRFQTVAETGKAEALRGSLENLEIDCMSCLVRMRTWDRT